MSLTNCTISNNNAALGGGGIYTEDATLNMNNTIVAGNTQTILSDLSGSPTGSNNLIGGDPVLAPLGNYGGPTQTMPELPGSLLALPPVQRRLAVDAGESSAATRSGPRRSWGWNGVIISGGGGSRVFQVDGGVTANISGLTITAGSTSKNGGGLYNDGGSVTPPTAR